jgi:phenylacetate-coenzyme A ligase PaaK-like adenylate-forming protein
MSDARNKFLKNVLEYGPFVSQTDLGAEQLLIALKELLELQRENCQEYRLFLQGISFNREVESIYDLPFLPARIFKNRRLSSINEEDIFRVLHSSGTTGSQSQIVLDAQSAEMQSRILSKTIQTGVGLGRSPMLIADFKEITRQSSARSAGVLGMMNLGRKHLFSIDQDFNFQLDAMREWLEEFGDSPFLIFGFTFMVWEYLYKHCLENDLNLENGVLIHSGGWKQMIENSVDNRTFKLRLSEDLGLTRVYNFYGMVEQIGSIYLEDEGLDPGLRIPSFCEVIIRDPKTFDPLPDGEVGLIQVISLLPISYPGFSVLTEDLGFRIAGVDDRKMQIIGRIPRSEVRGCSDSYTKLS